MLLCSASKIYSSQLENKRQEACVFLSKAENFDFEEEYSLEDVDVENKDLVDVLSKMRGL